MRATIIDPTLGASGAPAERSEGVAPGTVIDERYVVDGEIASGGMGIVLAVRSVAFGTRLAMKVLRREAAREVELVARFRREARAASALRHPNIVDVRDFGVLPDGRSYFVMERLEGPDLATVLEPGAISEARAIGIALDVLAALSAAHASELVHRDLKPENVILVRDAEGRERAKVVDFGVAKVLGDRLGRMSQPAFASGMTFSPKLSIAGSVLGTPAFMSPEHGMGRAVDGRSDLYSLGVLLYEMVTGVVPFDHPSPYEVVRLHVEALPLRPSQLAPELSPALESVILRCLEKRPDDRFASADEMAVALRALVDVPVADEERAPAAASARPSQRGSARALPLARRSRARVVMAALAAGTLAIAAGVAIVAALFPTRAATVRTPVAAPPRATKVASEPRSARPSATLLPSSSVVPPAALPVATSDETSSDDRSTDRAEAPARTHRTRIEAHPAPVAPDAPATSAAPPASPAMRQMIDPWEDGPS